MGVAQACAGGGLFVLGLALLGLVMAGPALAVDIIAHRDVSQAVLSVASARAIFGMRHVKWPDGTPIKVFVLADQHPTHGSLCKERLNLFPYQLRQSWDRLVYSGIAQAPGEVSSEEEMLSRVASTPGAIGYVRKAKTHDQVKILRIE